MASTTAAAGDRAGPVRPDHRTGWVEAALLGGALAGLASFTRAALELRHDGWLQAGLPAPAWNALRRHLDGSAAWLVLAALAGLALLLAAAGRLAPPRARAARLPLERGALAAAAFFAVTGHLVAPTPATPDLRTMRGKAGSAAVALATLGATAAATAVARRAAAGRRGALAAALTVAAAPPLLGLAAPPDCPPLGAARPSVVLISLDTLRADRVGCYGYARDTTPNLDAFARDAVRFDHVASPFPFTLTAHASLFTGLDPAAHGATADGAQVHERQPMFAGVPTLATAFRAAGWRTVAVVDDCLWLHPAYGLARGFELWRVVRGDLASKARALDELLRDLNGEPCFLFLHCFDVHSDFRQLPYDRAPEDAGVFSGWYRGPFDGSDPDDGTLSASRLLRHWNDSRAPVPDEVVRLVSDLYDEGVRSTDRVLGGVLARLDRAGFRDRAAVAITADHGEEFREHGRFLHDSQLFEESVRVPLLLRWPGARHAGAVVATPAALADVASTLAALAQVPFHAAQGRSLLGLVGEESAEEAPVFLGARAGEEGVRLGRYKLLRHGGECRLFDLDEDPAERVDVAARRPEIVRSLSALLDARAEENRAAAAAGVRGGAVLLSEDDRRRIEAIGYR